jgi:hypothetical protein
MLDFKVDFFQFLSRGLFYKRRFYKRPHLRSILTGQYQQQQQQQQAEVHFCPLGYIGHIINVKFSELFSVSCDNCDISSGVVWTTTQKKIAHKKCL